MRKVIRALALFSGGLDSALAIKVVTEQGVEVIALNFVSHFFGGNDERSEKMARQLGVRLEYIDFKERHTEVLKNPVYGYGKNMNPCIDCHSLMFKIAGELLEKYQADFVISGEVLGQRPMSQNSQALEKVKLLSEMGDLIVRPLSAKLLPITKPEIMGWLDREKLLNISGRSRLRQMELMEFYKLVEYPSPGGGCLLTDPSYSDRLKQVKEDNLLLDHNSFLFKLLKVTRFFRFDSGRYLFVGRNEESNKIMNDYIEQASFFIKTSSIPGPMILGYGYISEEEKEFAKKLFSRYSKVKGLKECEMNVEGENEVISSFEVAELEKVMKIYQQ